MYATQIYATMFFTFLTHTTNNRLYIFQTALKHTGNVNSVQIYNNAIIKQLSSNYIRTIFFTRVEMQSPASVHISP